MWFVRLQSYGFGGAGFGIRNVHEPPKMMLRPWGRALAEYSGSYLKVKARLFVGRMKVVWKPTA